MNELQLLEVYDGDFTVAIPAKQVRAIEQLPAAVDSVDTLASLLSGSKARPTPDARIVVIEARGGTSRVSVEWVAGITRVSADSVRMLPALFSRGASLKPHSSLILGTVAIPDRSSLALLLNADALVHLHAGSHSPS